MTLPAETAIEELEKLLNISVTIVDRDGRFSDASGKLLFFRLRHSHRKNRICDLGFCKNCILHCRHAMNAEGEKKRKPFIHECWKGVKEIVVPMIWQDIHIGSFFAGTWRIPNMESPRNADRLPGAAIDAYRQLPQFDKTQAESLETILEIFVQGLLVNLEQARYPVSAADNRISVIKSYIAKNASIAPSLKKLANKLNLSSSRTSHLVKELFGISFQELLRIERITRAKTLLLSSDENAGEIAERIGFSDEYHFNKMFKKYVGIPPGRYRLREHNS